MISGASGSTAFFLQPYEVFWINDRMGGRIFFCSTGFFFGKKDRFFLINKNCIRTYIIYSFIFNYVFSCIYIYI